MDKEIVKNIVKMIRSSDDNERTLGYDIVTTSDFKLNDENVQDVFLLCDIIDGQTISPPLKPFNDATIDEKTVHQYERWLALVKAKVKTKPIMKRIYEETYIVRRFKSADNNADVNIDG